MALADFCSTAPGIAVLDLMLPDLDGLVVCGQIRNISNVPILILTAHEDSIDEVAGLEPGADDDVNRPV
jgi:two-component system OmpR family response regulator